MDGVYILLFLFVLVMVFVLPIAALVKAASAQRQAAEANDANTQLANRIIILERQLHAIRHEADQPVTKTATPEPAPVPAPEPLQPARAVTPPPLPIPALEQQEPVIPQPPRLERDEPEVIAAPTEPFSWERFMGVKLFAWLGAVAMFFGVVFFVKYAFENNLISPALRIALGFAAGVTLLGGGLATHRIERYRVLAQAFCATGILILYGVSFAAHAVYHFEWFGNAQTFALMAGITLVAFLISVRLHALVVAVLGMLGGFLTPLLLSTGEDQVLTLFGYIALLNAGLLAVSRHARWRFLTPCAAVGTALMQVAWWAKFFAAGDYAIGAKTLIPLGILTGFLVLFLVGGWLFRPRPDRHTCGAVLWLAAVALGFAFLLLSYPTVANREFLLYGFVLLVNLAVIAVTVTRPQWEIARILTAAVTFFHLGVWTDIFLTPENLLHALGLYLVFGTIHAAVPVICSRLRADSVPHPVNSWFAPLVLAMIAMPLLMLPTVPLILWVAVLVADLLVIAVAVATRRPLPVLASLVMTMVLAAMWLNKGPTNDGDLLLFLGIVTGFSAVFAVVGSLFFRGLPISGNGGEFSEFRSLSASTAVPAAAGFLPFGMLALALQKFPIANPTPIFLVALLMSILLAGLAVFGKQGPLVLAALIGTLAVEGLWHLIDFRPASPHIALPWYLGFYAGFFALPFVFRRKFAPAVCPWIAAALASVGQFVLVHDLVKRAFPNDFMGLVPAAFAVPALAAVWAVRQMFPEMDTAQRSRLAWFGGVALLFITLIFPIQFERQWITVSWAVEGALLLWLFLRVPHPGLRITGLALLAIAFSRLALNPWVVFDYERGAMRIFNWQLYVYGTAAAAHFFGAYWVRAPRARGFLQVGGGLLLFILLNLQIADYFTPANRTTIDLSFSGNFARDMTYSISWGLFSLALLGIGFWRGAKGARYAATGLLVATLLKVFLHDLSQIQNIFRIGALVGVAIIAFIASFLYQRFFDRRDQE